MSLHLVPMALATLALSSTALAVLNQDSNQVAPPCTSWFTAFDYTGCYVAQGSPNTLPLQNPAPSGNMTVESCVAFCKGNGYLYAGLEYYGICYCGDFIDGPAAPAADCSFPCNGNPSEICGGFNRLSIYEDPTFPPSNPSTISDYTSLGCYTEAANYERALLFQQDLDPTTMTVEICLAGCKAYGLPYAGLEYSQECYCGTILAPGAVPTTPDQCNMPCNGNSSETCGGPRLLNLYYANDLASSEPCGYFPPTSSYTTSSTTTSPTSSTTSSITTTTPTTTPCANNVCFSTHFNSQSVPAGDVVWLSAAFKPKFSGSSALVSFTNSIVTINGVQSSAIPPDSFVNLQSSQQTCSTAEYVNGQWQTTAPLPGSGNTFFSAVSIPVPAGSNYANAAITWCGDVTAPGEVDVQIAAAVYTSCSNANASPEACETHTQYHAGVPTGCLNNLVPGGTGGGGSNFSGSLSATYAVCKAS